MKKPSSQKTSEQGFALVVIAAIFIAFAVVAASMIDRTNATQQITQQDTTRDQLSRISKAILQYYVFKGGYYPCPADPSLLPADNNYGKPVPNCNAASGVGAPDPTGKFLNGYPNVVILSNASPVSTEVIRGMVPIQALIPYGLSATDVNDFWNNRIMYVVNRMTTAPSGVASVTLQVTENSTQQVFQTPDFILISYGRDGVGAYPSSGSSISIACPTNSTTLRQVNCGRTLNFVQAPLETAASSTNTNYFDDLLSFTSATPPPCTQQTLHWGTVCSGVFATTANGSSQGPVSYVDASYTGSASATCTNSAWDVPVGNCDLNTVVVNGHCGAANGGTYISPGPTANLCSSGGAHAVLPTSGGGWGWTCFGSGGGTNEGCYAGDGSVNTRWTQQSQYNYGCSSSSSNCGDLNAPCPAGDNCTTNEWDGSQCLQTNYQCQ